MNKLLKISGILLITAMLLMGGSATAKSEQKDHIDDEQCDIGNDPNVKEVAVGLSSDGKDILMKRTTTHPIKPTSQKSTQSSKCYKLMGIKWATDNVPIDINPSVSDVDPTFVETVFSISASTWDDGTSRAVFGARTISTLGYGLNGRNTLFFGNSLGTGTIAQTTTWYYLKGRQIVEFDIEFNNNFVWGDASIDTTKMDIQNIATHELGHGIGLADLYTISCRSATMYGYSTKGETSKRTLESGDLTGLQRIYGR